MNKRHLKQQCAIRMYDAREAGWGAGRDWKTEFLVTVQADVVDKNVLLILNIYSIKKIINPHCEKVRPEYRIFLNKRRYEYETEDLTENKQNWTTMDMRSIAYKNFESRRIRGYELDSERDLNLLKQYLGFSSDPSWRGYIDRFQKEVKKRRLLKKNEKWIRETEEIMGEVPRLLPADFGKWIQQDVTYRSRYIYYRYDKKKKGQGQDGYCTHCRSKVKVDGALHRKEGLCPVCHSKITFLCKSKAGYVRDEIGAGIMQKVSSGFVIRTFHVCKRYDKSYQRPTLSVYEHSRVFIGFSGEIRQYQHGICEETQDSRWYPVKYMTSGERGVMYTGNMRKLLSETGLKYCGLYEYASSERGREINAAAYIKFFYSEKKIEYLAKMGMTSLIADITAEHTQSGFDFRKPTIFEIMGMSKEDTRYAQEANADLTTVRELKHLRRQNIKMSYQQFEDAREIFGNAYHDYLKMLKYGTPGKVIKYLRQQAEGKKRQRYQNILIDWIDYVSFGKQLGYDFKNDFVLYPKDLRARHDTASFLIQEKERERKKKEINKQNKQIKTLYEEWKEKYRFENKKLMIAAPKEASDIVEEGQKMHHCVGSYVQRVAKGETIILFIREKEHPEEPFYTMEIKGGKVSQCRGKYNAGMTEEVKRFVEQFEKKMLNPKPKQEKRKKIRAA